MNIRMWMISMYIFLMKKTHPITSFHLMLKRRKVAIYLCRKTIKEPWLFGVLMLALVLEKYRN